MSLVDPSKTVEVLLVQKVSEVLKAGLGQLFTGGPRWVLTGQRGLAGQQQTVFS